MFNNFSARWNKNVPMCIKNFTVAIPYGKITAVIGKIGSGKSSLLLAFLKEIPDTSGRLDFQGSVAYVE
jgi:ABC-type bacteriocin/lantibiotic exporter with double-glycine peptidase domain